jgi:hypothetical protein
MWIMVSGPYASGAADEVARTANLRALNQAALGVLDKGHVPIIGVNLAPPIIAVAGPQRYDAIMMPISLALAERCDACLRVGGASSGADREVARFRSRGRAVYVSVDDIPAADREAVGSDPR